MATPSYYYVDPAIKADGGSGSLASPWTRASGSVVQYSLDTITRNTSEGDVIFVKSGAADVLSAPLSLTTFGTPTLATGLVIAGYSESPWDGVVGEISGGGSVSVWTNTNANIHFCDMKLGNCGSSAVVAGGAGYWRSLVRCEIHSTTGNGMSSGFANLIGCKFHNIAGIGAQHQGGDVIGCLFQNGANKFTTALYSQSQQICFNRFLLSGSGNSSTAIYVYNYYVTAKHNSIWSQSGTGKGLDFAYGTWYASAYNNIIEGFSGAGGRAINGLGNKVPVLAGNAFYNNTLNTDAASFGMMQFDNEVLSESPFNNAAVGDFSVKRIGNLLSPIQWAGGSGFKGACCPVDSSGTARPSHPLLQQVIG